MAMEPMKAHHINVIIARILPRHQKLQNIIGQDNDMRACSPPSYQDRGEKVQLEDDRRTQWSRVGMARSE